MRPPAAAHPSGLSRRGRGDRQDRVCAQTALLFKLIFPRVFFFFFFSGGVSSHELLKSNG